MEKRLLQEWRTGLAWINQSNKTQLDNSNKFKPSRALNWPCLADWKMIGCYRTTCRVSDRNLRAFFSPCIFVIRTEGYNTSISCHHFPVTMATSHDITGIRWARDQVKSSCSSSSQFLFLCDSPARYQSCPSAFPTTAEISQGSGSCYGDNDSTISINEI